MKTLLLILCSCTANLHNINHASLGTALATTACDMGQTYWAASHNWRINGEQAMERNSMLGQNPDTSVVATYAVASMVLIAGIHILLPKVAKSPFGFAMAGREVVAVGRNLGTGLPLCGL